MLTEDVLFPDKYEVGAPLIVDEVDHIGSLVISGKLILEGFLIVQIVYVLFREVCKKLDCSGRCNNVLAAVGDTDDHVVIIDC
jgi:hypothetical protein